MAEYEHVLVKNDGDVVRITMNRPERRNALSEPHLRELLAAFTEAGDSDATGIVLGAEGKAFSAGHDFADVAARDLAGVRDLLRLCTRVMRTVQEVPQVVIARVQAVATAAGCQLVASCDLAVAAESATFALPGGKGGWFCHTPAVPVARNIGRKRLMELALTGDAIDARTAAEWGLVNRAVPDAELDAGHRRPPGPRHPRQPVRQGRRQADALRAARPAGGRCVRDRRRGHGVALADARRAGGHGGVPGEAPGGLAGLTVTGGDPLATGTPEAPTEARKQP